MVETSSREDNIYYARLAEQGERYEDMIHHMQAVANVSAITLFLKERQTGESKLFDQLLMRTKLMLVNQWY